MNGGKHLTAENVSSLCADCALCPGDLILKACDAARELRDTDVTVIGGFHSPMEKIKVSFPDPAF